MVCLRRARGFNGKDPPQEVESIRATRVAAHLRALAKSEWRSPSVGASIRSNELLVGKGPCAKVVQLCQLLLTGTFCRTPF